MTRWAKVILGLAGLALVLGVSTLAIESNLAGKAQLVQIVQVDQTASELFGDAEPTPIGSAQQMIISDESVFLDGKSPEGARLADDARLKAAGIYPLQLKTVEFTLGMVRVGLLIGAFVLGVIGAVVARKQRRADLVSSIV